MRKALAGRGTESAIFLLLAARFFLERYPGLAGWSPTWYALSYAKGRGSRLLAGSILRLFVGETVTEKAAYAFVSIAILVCCALIALFLAAALRRTRESCRVACFVLICCYLVSPYSPASLWNEVNMGRLDVFLLLLSALSGLLALLVKNYYVRLSVLSAISVVALLFHQVFFFIFFPFLLSMLFYDAWVGGSIDRRRLFALIGAAVLIGGVFLMLQLGSRLNAPSAAALMDELSKTTDLGVSRDALTFEYFESFAFNFQNHVLPFYRAENPLGHAFSTLIVLLPVLALFFFLWKGLLSRQAGEGGIWTRPYVYLLGVNLLYAPAFLLAVDWNRWFMAFFACQTFLMLFLLARRDGAAERAGEALSAGVRAHPMLFLAGICYLSFLEPFGARYFTRQANSVYDGIRTLIQGILGGNR